MHVCDSMQLVWQFGVGDRMGWVKHLETAIYTSTSSTPLTRHIPVQGLCHYVCLRSVIHIHKVVISAQTWLHHHDRGYPDTQYRPENFRQKKQNETEGSSWVITVCLIRHLICTHYDPWMFMKIKMFACSCKISLSNLHEMYLSTHDY